MSSTSRASRWSCASSAGTDDIIIPRGDTTIKEHDQVIAITTPELEEDLRAAILGEDHRE